MVFIIALFLGEYGHLKSQLTDWSKVDRGLGLCNRREDLNGQHANLYGNI